MKSSSLQSGFIQASVLFGIMLLSIMLGMFAYANREHGAKLDPEQAKAGASVDIRQSTDIANAYLDAYLDGATINSITDLVSALYLDSLPLHPNGSSGGAWSLVKSSVLTGVGTAAGDDYIVLTGVPERTCKHINAKLIGTDVTNPISETDATWNGAAITLSAGGWPGRHGGCVYHTGASADGYAYYRVIYAR